MRLTTITHVKVDGFMQGPGGADEDRRGGFERGGWAPPLFDGEAAAFVNRVYQRADAFLRGRRTVVEALAAAIASVPRFDAVCESTGWFGDDVLWLDPQPADRFRALTSAVTDAFPAHRPYGGEYDEVVPHLTVGHGVEAGQPRRAEEQVLRQLPIRIDVTAAAVWCGTDTVGTWRQVADLPLG